MDIKTYRLYILVKATKDNEQKDNAIYYVGITAQQPAERLRKHLAEARKLNPNRPAIYQSAKSEWIRSQNFEVEMRTVGAPIHTKAEADAWERAFIELQSQTHPLLNKCFNSRLLRADAKKVYQYEKDGTFVREWESATQAHAENPKFVRTNIVKVCNDKYSSNKSCAGFIWSYLSPEEIKETN